MSRAEPAIFDTHGYDREALVSEHTVALLLSLNRKPM
jgi:hypothetical protein